MRRVSVSTALFDGYPLEQGLAEVASAGFRFVEPAYIKGYMDFEEHTFSNANAAKLAGQVEAAGLECLGLSAHTDMAMPDAVAEVERRLRFAQSIGSSILITNSTVKANFLEFRRNLDILIPICEATNVILCLENPGHGRESLIAGGLDGTELMRSVGSPWVRLNYDFGNCFTYNNEVVPQDDFEVALPWVAHAHLKDVISSSAGWAFAAIGEGSIGYEAIARTLVAIAPELPVGLELPLRLSRAGRQAPRRAPEPVPLRDISRALASTRMFLTKAGIIHATDL